MIEVVEIKRERRNSEQDAMPVVKTTFQRVV